MKQIYILTGIDLKDMEKVVKKVAKKNSFFNDGYTEKNLRKSFEIDKEYIVKRENFTIENNKKIRRPHMSEDITENIVKFILRNKLKQDVVWKNNLYPKLKKIIGRSDLLSKQEGKIECKAFMSNGPISFSPKSDWNVICFLDIRKLKEGKIILYKVNLSAKSEEWKNIGINNTQSFDIQTKQKRRPRGGWDYLYPLIKSWCSKVFEGSFEDVFKKKRN